MLKNTRTRLNLMSLERRDTPTRFTPIEASQFDIAQLELATMKAMEKIDASAGTRVRGETPAKVDLRLGNLPKDVVFVLEPIKLDGGAPEWK